MRKSPTKPKRAKQKLIVKRKLSRKQKWQMLGWTICIMAWVFASIVVAQLVVGKLMILTLGKEVFMKNVTIAIYSALSYVVAVALVIYVPAKLSALWKNRERISAEAPKDKHARIKIDRVELGLRGLPTWTDIGLAPVGLIVSLLLAAGLIWVFNLFPWFDAEQAQDIGFSVYAAGFDRAIAFLTLVVVAPIAEEIIFRGWLYGKMRERFSQSMSNTVSIIISSLLVSILFGLIHMQWNVGVNVFAMSLVMCGLREITGTIYAGVLLHMIKNGLAFYLIYVLGI